MQNDIWADIKEMADKADSGSYIRLKNDGEKVVLAFVGNPAARQMIWLDGKTFEHNPGNPEHANLKPNIKISINAWVPSEKKMKIMEGNSKWFKDVAKVREKYGLGKWFFEVERHGAKGDMQTTYSILPDREITPAERAEIDAAKAFDLNAKLSQLASQDEMPF